MNDINKETMYVRYMIFSPYLDPDDITSNTGIIPTEVNYGGAHRLAPVHRPSYARRVSSWFLLSRLPMENLHEDEHIKDIFDQLYPHLDYLKTLMRTVKEIEAGFLVSLHNRLGTELSKESIERISLLEASISFYMYLAN